MISTVWDSLYKVQCFVFTEVTEFIDHIHITEIEHVEEFVTLYYHLDSEGVLISCRSKFKARGKSLSKADKNSDEQASKEDGKFKETKKRRLSFLRKRRKYSDAAKTEEDTMGLINSTEKESESKKRTGNKINNKSLSSDEKNNTVTQKCEKVQTNNEVLKSNKEKEKGLKSSREESKKPNSVIHKLNNNFTEKRDEEVKAFKPIVSPNTEIIIVEEKKTQKVSSRIYEPTTAGGNIPTSNSNQPNAVTEGEPRDRATKVPPKARISHLKLFTLHEFSEKLAGTIFILSMKESKPFLTSVKRSKYKSDVSKSPKNLPKVNFEKVDLISNTIAREILGGAILEVKDISHKNCNGAIVTFELIVEDSKNKGSIELTSSETSHSSISDISNDIDGPKKHSFLRSKTNHLTTKRGTDRPLSGYAEQLAEFLDDDDLDFLDSDEEISESFAKIKENFGLERRVSVEVSKLQDQFTDAQLNKHGNTKALKTKANQLSNRKQTKRVRSRGDRPMSLYAQDMLNDILTVTLEEEDDIMSDKNSEPEVDTLEDLPVKARIEFMEHTIPLPMRQQSLNDYDICSDEMMRSHSLSFGPPVDNKPLNLREAAVIDLGCGILKAGICGEMQPSCYCPSVIGVPRRFSQDASKMKKPYYVGDEAWEMAGMLQIEHPIKPNISNWSDVSNIMEHLLESELNINDNEHPIILTETGCNSKKHREKLTEIMFEQFMIPSFYLADQSVLAMYSMGLVSGVCLNSGFYHTQTTPIYEGHSILHAISHLDIGGSTVTDYLGRRLMANQGLTFNTSSEKLVLNSMKQSLCYVAKDPKAEEQKYTNKADLYEMYALPDGQDVEIGAERFVAPEILFDPKMLGLNQMNVVELVSNTIDLVDEELHELFSSNIIVTGGNTKITGFANRFVSELSTQERELSSKCADNPLLATWIGGSILSSISGYREQWMSMDQYAEYGSKLVHQLCF